MSSGIIETIKKVALNAFEASAPVKLLFGKVVSTNPVKIQVGELLTLTKEFLVINGTVYEGDAVTLIRVQGGQKYVVLGTRMGYVENTIYTGGGETLPDGVAVTSASGDWQFPHKGGYVVTSPYGVKRSNGKIHHGVDLVGTNKLVYPVNSGTVVSKKYDANGYGNYVVVNHGNGYWSLYGHFKKVHVKVGDAVNKNTVLGIEGSTGYSTGSHVHLEIRKGANSISNVINPVTFLKNN